MDCHNATDPCVEELEKKARKITTSIKATICTGNSVVIFTMLLLEEILKQLALDPITNLNEILVISDIIADLNSSIQIDP